MTTRRRSKVIRFKGRVGYDHAGAAGILVPMSVGKRLGGELYIKAHATIRGIPFHVQLTPNWLVQEPEYYEPELEQIGWFIYFYSKMEPVLAERWPVLRIGEQMDVVIQPEPHQTLGARGHKAGPEPMKSKEERMAEREARRNAKEQAAREKARARAERARARARRGEGRR